jgi:D-sedoheptulose 7-phosphate isomerase
LLVDLPAIHITATGQDRRAVGQLMEVLVMRDDVLHKQMEETIDVARWVQGNLALVRSVAAMLIEKLGANHLVLLAGNGGSALDAQHLASELVGHFRGDRRSLPAVALTSDGGLLTAIANDYDFTSLFSRQIEGLGKPGDVFIGFSTSGRSPNVLAALDTARKQGLVTVGFAGRGGGEMKGRCDYELFLPHESTARVQEGHLMLLHLICEHIEEAFVEG